MKSEQARLSTSKPNTGKEEKGPGSIKEEKGPGSIKEEKGPGSINVMANE